MTAEQHDAAFLVSALLTAAAPPERLCNCCGKSIGHRPPNALYCNEEHRRRHEEAKRRQRLAEERAKARETALVDPWADALTPKPCRCIPSGQVLGSTLNGSRRLIPTADLERWVEQHSTPPAVEEVARDAE